MLTQRPSRNTSGKIKRFFLFLLLLAAAAAGAAWHFLFEDEKPQAEIHLDKLWRGDTLTLSLRAYDKKSGIRSVRLTAITGDKRKILFSKENMRQGYTPPVAPVEEKTTININYKKLGVSNGAVQFLLEVSDFSLRRNFQGNQTVAEQSITLNNQGSYVNILYSEQRITPGRSGVVVYQTKKRPAVTGLLLNGRFNQAYPVAEKEDTFIAYYGVPHNAKSLIEFAIVATDNATYRTLAPVTATFTPPKRKEDTINLGDGFLNRKIPEFQQYYPEMSGDVLGQYLYINNTIRQQNAATIDEICQKTSPNQLWHGAFKRMPGSKRAGFAEYRSYLYKGEVVDHQVHLGVDIASIRHDKIKAANSGVIVFADYLGIYGKMVIIDHGQGVFSLYSHLSQITLSPGTAVKQGDIIGRSGTSGMAGGDHLHFSMLVHGVFVDPKEWWDKRFIKHHFTAPVKRVQPHTAAAAKKR